MKSLKILIAILFTVVLTSCNNEQSLQKYYVENQENTDFLALDIPTSMFANSESLEMDEKETLQSIKKINVLALKKEENPEKFEEEKVKLAEIFKNEKYQLLMKYGGGDRKAELYFTGKDDAIDELIVYGYDNEQGLGVARVLGEDMNPQKIMELMKSLDKDNIDIEGIKGLGKIFGDSSKEKDSVRIETKIEVGDKAQEASEENDTTKM
ncbi:DUF4252 domain-containing protein [Gramella sp. MAR_2010_147]|uniref:DUF4252 domain-containing protein n=1 Tax=Gramella sp. MAR_2010_147 TaxID=1250205 RepID=UPI00087A502A|nr:DUF4252 domain-containing protein [Gramella sp. MAR_2010_147]SDR85410.1 protein of unknown function [Gramella sp. MAR_2010_147]